MTTDPPPDTSDAKTAALVLESLETEPVALNFEFRIRQCYTAYTRVQLD